MSRDEIESRARPPSIRTGRQPRSSGSVRGMAANKPAGYDNPLYTSGDVLSDRDATNAMPVVVGDHVVSTPRQPESPLVAKLKAQAADKSQKLRQDRILNSTVTSSSASNPFFPGSPLSPRSVVTNDNDRPRSSRVRPSSHSLADPRFRPSPAHPRMCESSRASTCDAEADDDAESLDSIVLDESPCPLRMATPGGGVRVGAFGAAFGAAPLDSMPSSPSGSPIRRAGTEPQPDAESDVAASHGAEASAAIAPQESNIPAAGSDAATLAAAAADATRPVTPTQDRELLKLQSADMPKFVRTPGPLLEPMKCYIVREKASGGLLSKAPHCYKLYLEDGDVFLLAARRRERTKCPSYVISLDETELSRSGSGYCGKIKSNFIGTEFQILDNGERRNSPLKRQGSFLGGPRHQLPTPEQGPTAESGDERATSPDDGRSELGLVQYHMNVMGTKGPRKMVIGVPYVDFDTNVPVKWAGGNRMSRLKRDTCDDNEMIRFVNKVPKWNSTLGAYCLNFNGRVTQASVKNFQLVSEGDEQEREVLQFGRVAENRFTMDYAWPLSAYQAFCICITSLDSKLACE